MDGRAGGVEHGVLGEVGQYGSEIPPFLLQGSRVWGSRTLGFTPKPVHRAVPVHKLHEGQHEDPLHCLRRRADPSLPGQASLERQVPGCSWSEVV